jgi:hypothetical protein
MGIGITTQQNNRIDLPIVATGEDRILIQVEKIEDLAKNVIDPRVVWVRELQKFLDFFCINDVSLNVTLPHIRTGFKRTRGIIIP